MPHLSIEYSANLVETIDFDALCGAISAVILSTGLFEEGAVRVRAFKADAYAIADQLPANGFVDMSFRIGAGRTDTEKREVGGKIFEVVRQRLSGHFAAPHFALSLEVREIDPALSWKANSMHKLSADCSRSPKPPSDSFDPTGFVRFVGNRKGADTQQTS